jgi:hypothetical protein
VKSVLIVLRHLVRLGGAAAPRSYPAAVEAAEALIGPLPAIRGALAHREGEAAPEPEMTRTRAASYVAEVERVVAAVTAQCV